MQSMNVGHEARIRRLAAVLRQGTGFLPRIRRRRRREWGCLGAPPLVPAPAVPRPGPNPSHPTSAVPRTGRNWPPAGQLGLRSRVTTGPGAFPQASDAALRNLAGRKASPGKVLHEEVYHGAARQAQPQSDPAAARLAREAVVASLAGCGEPARFGRAPVGRQPGLRHCRCRSGDSRLRQDFVAQCR
jgi:capsular polysaccharide biosynthesis protein